MSKSCIPYADQEYNSWLQNFVTQLLANVATFGMVASDVDALADSQSNFDAAYTNHKAAQLASKAATAQKVNRRDESLELLRPIVRRIQNHPGMTDALRGILGLVPQTIGESALPIDTLKPNMLLKTGPGKVFVHWGISPQNERLNRKPEGVLVGVVYRKKAGEEDYQMVGFSTSSPYVDTIVGTAEDYVYVVRYRGTDPKDVSLQSEAAMIAARGELAA